MESDSISIPKRKRKRGSNSLGSKTFNQGADSVDAMKLKSKQPESDLSVK